MKRTATAVWNGTGKEGSGTISTPTNTLSKVKYNYKMRFEDEPGTNPEELMAAAHAGCFSMKLSFILGAAGFTPTELETQCTITLEAGTITSSHLSVKGTVPGITKEKFEECVAEAKTTCPVSKAFAAIPSITADATLA